MTWNPFGVAFGRAMREIRKKKRITLLGLAEKAGIIYPFCSAVECGNSASRLGVTYDNCFVGECLAEGLGLADGSARRFACAFVASRELTRMQRADGWLGSSVAYARILLEREPNLSPVLWPALQLAMKEENPAPHLQSMLVEEAELVHRTREYILREPSPDIFVPHKKVAA